MFEDGNLLSYLLTTPEKVANSQYSQIRSKIPC